jgi:tetratricopeptide (TPR) repeat protein
LLSICYNDVINYHEALEGIDKASVFELNDVFILKTCVDVKMMLQDYQRALKDLDKAHVLKPNDVIILKICEDVKKC